MEHHVREVLIINLLSLPLVSNGPVLAEHTTEIAIGEEDGARSLLPHQRYLLAEMWLSHINDNSGRGAAEPLFSISAICTTLSGTELAFPKN
jgi:hypothetical protein